MHCANRITDGCRGQVPVTGRAAVHGLCCKCDREKHGPLSIGEKGVKQIQREIRQGQISPQKGEELLTAYQT